MLLGFGQPRTSRSRSCDGGHFFSSSLLWDADTRARLTLRVVLLNSAPLLIQRGLSESLAGRFELLPVPHWPLAEMRAATTIDQSP